MAKNVCINCNSEFSLFKKVCPKCGFEIEFLFDDKLLLEVIELVVRNQECSINNIQMHFRLGFNRAKRIVKDLESYGIVSKSLKMKPIKVLISLNEIIDLVNE